MNHWAKQLVLTVLPTLVLMGCSDSSESAIVPGAVTPAESQDTGTRLEGAFRYMADTPLFRDCRTGEVFPVAMAGPYLELENAYFNSGIAPGEELEVSVHGRFLERPGMEGNSNVIMLVIDSFDGVSDSMDCVPTMQAELNNTYWKLIELEGVVVKPVKGAREIHLVLGAGTARVNGFAGCNNFFGQYRQEGESLTFSALGSTRMACPEGMDTEQAFLKALGETDQAVVNGMFLQLYSSHRTVARLEAVYLP